MSAQGRQEYEINARYEVFTFLSGAYFLTNYMRIPGGRVPAGRAALHPDEAREDDPARDVAPASFLKMSAAGSSVSQLIAHANYARGQCYRESRETPVGHDATTRSTH